MSKVITCVCPCGRSYDFPWTMSVCVKLSNNLHDTSNRPLCVSYASHSKLEIQIRPLKEDPRGK